MPRTRQRANPIRAEAGFTLVELLVVMLILGLLAAIAIPSFFAQRDKARDAAAKTEVRTAATALETYRSDHDGSYAGATVPDLEAIETTLAAATLAVGVAGADEYAISATSQTGNTFTIERNPNGTTDFTCAAPGTAGCPADGTWSG